MIVCSLAPSSKTNDICTKRKLQSESLDKEANSKINEDNKCSICYLNFNNESELTKHTTNEHNNKPRTCYYCDMVFTTMSTLEWVVVQREHENNNCMIKKQYIEDNEYKCVSHEESYDTET